MSRRLIDHHVVLTIDNRAVVYVNVMHTVHALYAAGPDAGLAATTDDVADVNVLKVGHATGVLVSLGIVPLHFAGRSVSVVALEDDGFARDVAHHDV